MGFKTISKDDIKKFIENNNSEKWASVKKIQEIKEDAVKRLIKWFSQEWIKFIDPKLVWWIEKDYFEILKKYDGYIDENYDYSQDKKKIEQMFKENIFDKNYVGNFQEILWSNMIEISKEKLQNRKKEFEIKWQKMSQKEKGEFEAIKRIIGLLSNNNIENTRSRKINFDKDEFNKSQDKFNIACFFEEDKNWNKNYFSANQLLNDLETFGVEVWYPDINWSTVSENNEFISLQKFIKLALVKNILNKYRDYQEILMYDLRDYEKQYSKNQYQNKSGVLAEKVVERYFRDIANDDGENSIKIKKASAWEDQKNKVDLIIQLKNKKTWINIEKELQLTINKNEDVLQQKRIQIERQNKNWNSNLDLLKLELNLLDQKVNIWRNSDRPIWWIWDLLSIEDQEFLKKSYIWIKEELENKIKKSS